MINEDFIANKAKDCNAIETIKKIRNILNG